MEVPPALEIDEQVPMDNHMINLTEAALEAHANAAGDSPKELSIETPSPLQVGGDSSPSPGNKRKFVPVVPCDLMKRFGPMLAGMPKKPHCASSSGVSVPATATNVKQEPCKEERQVVKFSAKDSEAPCIVCGLWFESMPSNCDMCWTHKRSSDTMRKQRAPPGPRCKNPPSLELQQQNQKKLELYKHYKKKAAKLPPSQFAKMVLDYMATCPKNERGHRAEYAIMTFHEKEKKFTKVESGRK